jgi:hypothetical protein
MARREGRRGHVHKQEAAVQRESPCNEEDECRATTEPTGAHDENRRLEEAFQQLGREAGGAYDIGILRVGSSLSCREQLLLTQWGFDVAKQMAKGGPSALCLVCDTEFPPEHPDAFLVITAHRADPSVAMLSPICARCATKSDVELVDIYVENARQNGDADLRVLPAEHFHRAGRA